MIGCIIGLVVKNVVVVWDVRKSLVVVFVGVRFVIVDE